MIFEFEVDKAKVEFLGCGDLRSAILVFAGELVFREAKKFKVLIVIEFLVFAFLKTMDWRL